MGEARIAVDVGGTFTDVVLFDEETGNISITKIPSIPKAPEEAVIRGVLRILEETGSTVDIVGFLGHGTTVATNAIIEKKGAKVGLITTDGFRDVLEMGRQKRPTVYDYNLEAFTPIFMAPRRRRLGVRERVDCEGRIIEPLDEPRVIEILDDFKKQRVESIAVCLLFSFLNASHENRILDLISSKAPDISVSLSSVVLPEFREYERTCATVFDAYVSPVIDRYIERLEDKIASAGLKARVQIMQSNGGIMTADLFRQRSILTFLSGPAAGVMGSAFMGNILGYKNMISLDMGGTSCDVSLVKDGLPAYSNDNEIDGYPLKIQMVDVVTVGAGGGSIAWVDPGGVLKSGPQSSGADPGPACYAQGGEDTTNTDANLVLGYLDTSTFVGGEMTIDKALAYAALQKKIAKPLGMDVLVAANGIFKITTSNMMGAIRKVSVLRGYDPRDYWLFAFGGSGPVYAGKLASELKMKGTIIPMHPGVQSAFGILTVDYKFDFVRTWKQPVNGGDLERINSYFAEMERSAAEMLKTEGLKGELILKRSADMRYVGQAYELNVPVPGGVMHPAHLDSITKTFNKIHNDVYKHYAEEEPVEFINYRLAAYLRSEKPKILKVDPRERVKNPNAAVKVKRHAFFEELGGLVEVPVYSRELLETNTMIEGPAIIEQLDTTTVVYPGQVAGVDMYMNLIMKFQ